MNRLAGISLIVGAVCGMFSACMLFAPDLALRYMKKFPRSRVAGAVLACIALSWAAILLMNMNMGFLEKYKPLLMILAPLALVLIVFFVDDLLAPRALGGLLLLVPAPLLDSARWLDSAWRYFAIVSAYLMVIKGITLVLNPYLFRKWSSVFIKTGISARIYGGVGMIYSAIWIILAFTVYR